MAESQQAQINMGALSQFVRLAKGSPKLVIGMVLFILLAAAAIFEPVINNARLDGQRSTEIGNYDVLLSASSKHPLGTDHFGRDVLALLFTGLKNSLLIGLIAAALATAIAVTLATIVGYIGGRVEAVITTFLRGPGKGVRLRNMVHHVQRNLAQLPALHSPWIHLRGYWEHCRRNGA
jgi:peptide/nickel transport system permease protein